MAGQRTGPGVGGGSAVGRLRALVGEVRQGCAGQDVMLYAAGLTFYAAVALVPLTLIAIWVAGLVLGDSTVRHLTDSLAGSLPHRDGLSRSAQHAVRVGTSLGVGSIVASLFPASWYGEGLVRGFARLVPDHESLPRGLRGRLFSLAICGSAPLVMIAGLSAAGGLSKVLGSGPVPRLIGLVLAFLTCWVLASLLLAGAYRLFGPLQLRPRALALGAGATGAYTAGAVVTMTLLLRLPLTPGRAYGGSQLVALLVLLAGFLYLLHAAVLLGYLVTVVLHRHDGRLPAATRRGPRRRRGWLPGRRRATGAPRPTG